MDNRAKIEQKAVHNFQLGLGKLFFVVLLKYKRAESDEQEIILVLPSSDYFLVFYNTGQSQQKIIL